MVTEPFRVLMRALAQDDTSGPRPHELLDAIGRADPTAHLNVERRGGAEHLFDELLIGSVRGGRIQVGNVEVAQTRGRPSRARWPPDRRTVRDATPEALPLELGACAIPNIECGYRDQGWLLIEVN